MTTTGRAEQDTGSVTLTEAARSLRSGEVTAVGLLEDALAAADLQDGRVGSFISRYDEAAAAAAARADAELAAGRDRGPLHGIPIGLKDNLVSADGPLTAQSASLESSWGGGRDGAAVARLRAGGAVIVGKTTTMEFAIGLPDPTRSFPLPRNPWNLNRWAGGSSSGSGSGLAAGFFLGALGTDTAGSIRLPAAFCGVSGLKPTFGLVPKSGCVPLGYSYDHVGPMARSAADCAAILDVIAGFDPADPFSLDSPKRDYASRLDGSLDGLVIGVDRLAGLAVEADPELEARFAAALAALEAAGASVVEVEIPLYRQLTTTTMIGELSEAFAFHRERMRMRWEDYGAATRLTIATGGLVSGADYVQAQRVRRAGQAAIAELFRRVDLIVTPTAAIGAQPLEGLDFAEIIDAIHTPVWNAVGNPAMSVPIGPSAEGLPLAMQIVGPLLGDGSVLRAGDAFQRRTDWHLRQPSFSSEIEGDAPAAVGPGSATSVDPHSLVRVEALLKGSRLPGGDEEAAALAAGLDALDREVDALYQVPEALLAEPILVNPSAINSNSL
jgi:aspartyl-tRNA(Asn)/glutamyl-tRNA(Gln) amidotransferase subunit A